MCCKSTCPKGPTRRIPAPRPAGRRFATFRFVPDKSVEPEGSHSPLENVQ